MKTRLFFLQWILLGVFAYMSNTNLYSQNPVAIYLHHNEGQVNSNNEKAVTLYYYDTNPTKKGWVTEGIQFFVFNNQNDRPGLIPIYQSMTDDHRQLWRNDTPADWDTGWNIVFYAFAEPYVEKGSLATKPVYNYGGNLSNGSYTFYSTNANLTRPAVEGVGGFQKSSIMFHAVPRTLSNLPSSNILYDFPLIGQETNMWCWAACTEMVMAYYYTYITQCGEANRRFTRTDCCSNQQSKFDPDKCRKGGWFQINNHGMTSTQLGTSSVPVAADKIISWETLKAEIDATRPVPFAWAWFPWSNPWAKSGGHAMVATGYLQQGKTRMVLISDPWPVGTGDHKWVTYEQFKSQKNNHTHWVDLLNIQYKSK